MDVRGQLLSRKKMADDEEKETEWLSEDIELSPCRSSRQAKKNARLSQIILKNERNALTKRVSLIVKKDDSERTEEDTELLDKYPDLAKRLTKLALRRDAVKSRNLEIEDPEDVLHDKCQTLASAIKHSKKVVIYTGAGISTAASIPDYRGPNGVWTLLQKGQQPIAQDLSDAKPTVTHMCITKLYREGHIKHVVSQNCDGLHLRSGLSRKILSEVHGNMFVEICTHCKPQKEYIRLFDVTEKTGVRRHNTDRKCHMCGKNLRDTIVHFGEKGGLKSPYRWKEAAKAANSCDIILCLGTSLKILKKYPCLWCMDRRMKNRPKLFIVNLQWTPKDDSATLKINGRCDDVMERVMKILDLNIPQYYQEEDPIYHLYTPLKIREKNTTAKKILKVPPNIRKQKNVKRPPSVKNLMGDQRQESSMCLPVVKEEFLQKVKSGAEHQFSAIKDFLNKPAGDMTPSQTVPFLGQPSFAPSFAHNFVMPSPTNGIGGLQALNGQLPVWSQDFFKILHANQFYQQVSSQNIDTGQCKKCINQSGNSDHLKCSCPKSTYSTQGNSVPIYPGNLPFLPMSYPIPMNYSGMNMQFPNAWPISCQDIYKQPPHVQVEEVETVLRDHCYLNKTQMQKLSPRRDNSSGLSFVNLPTQGLMFSTPNQIAGQNTSKQGCSLSPESTKCVKRKKPSVTLSSTSKFKRLEQSSDKQFNNSEGANHFVSTEESSNTDEKLTSTKKESSDSSSVVKSKDNLKLERSVSQQDDSEIDSDKTVNELKKTELKRSVSVPGWFGKGLNVRKKKKF